MPTKDPEKRRLINKRYYEKNCDSIRARNARYLAEHPDRRRETSARYHRKNAVRINARKVVYHQNHPEQHRATNDRYRERHPERVKAQERASRKRNPERIRLMKARHHQKHRAKILAKAAVYYALHSTEIRARVSMYIVLHPEKVAEFRENRRARVALAPVYDLSTAQWLEIKAANGFRCVYCPPDCPACQRKSHALTKDHITPLGPDGPHTLHNIVPACRSCNARKQRGAPLVPVQPLLLTLALPQAKKKKS